MLLPLSRTTSNLVRQCKLRNCYREMTDSFLLYSSE